MKINNIKMILIIILITIVCIESGVILHNFYHIKQIEENMIEYDRRYEVQLELWDMQTQFNSNVKDVLGY